MPNTDTLLAHNLRRLFLNFSVYGGIGLVSKLVYFISIPLLTFHLSISDYGILEYFYTFSYLLVVILACGQDAAVARFFYECKNNSEKQNLVTTSLLFQLVMALLIIPTLWLLSDQISFLLVDVSEKLVFFKLILLQVPFLLVIDFCSGLLKWATARARFILLTIGFAFCQLAALITTAIFFELDIYFALAANFFASVVFSLVGLFLIRNWLNWPSNFSFLQKLLPFAFPIGIVAIITCLQPIFERGLINSYLGLESLGIYALATKILLLAVLVFSAFQSAWGPFSMTSFSESELIGRNSFVLKLFCAFGSIFVLLVGLAADPLIQILGGEHYRSGAIVVVILVLSQLIQNVGWILELGIRLSKKTYLTTFAFIGGLFSMAVLVSLLAPRYGLTGVAIGILIGRLTTVLAISIMAHRVHRIAYEYWSVSLFLGITTIVVFGSVLFRGVYGLVASSITLVFGLALIIFWSGTRLFGDEEKNIIAKVVVFSQTKSY